MGCEERSGEGREERRGMDVSREVEGNVRREVGRDVRIEVGREVGRDVRMLYNIKKMEMTIFNIDLH